jgi:hypothetical protein
MNGMAYTQPMNKKRARMPFTIIDLLGIFILWIGYHELKNCFLAINHEAEAI